MCIGCRCHSGFNRPSIFCIQPKRFACEHFIYRASSNEPNSTPYRTGPNRTYGNAFFDVGGLVVVPSRPEAFVPDLVSWSNQRPRVLDPPGSPLGVNRFSMFMDRADQRYRSQGMDDFPNSLFWAMEADQCLSSNSNKRRCGTNSQKLDTCRTI